MMMLGDLILQVDWEELGDKLGRMECDCKMSWDHLRLIAKHASHSGLKARSDILSHYSGTPFERPP